MTAGARPPVDHSEELPDQARDSLRALLLVLADSKRLLGLRYSDWMLGAPTLESGIAASSMAQDEWGHGRLTYALLSDFGDDPKAIEHERGAADFRSIQVLDRPLRSWAELVAVNLLVDTALAVQYGALRESRYTPVHNRVQKLLDEEDFHFQHAAAWTRRLMAADGVAAAFTATISELLPPVLQWFGPADTVVSRALVEQGVLSSRPDELRAHLLDCIAPLLGDEGVERVGLFPEDDGWRYAHPLDWHGWDGQTRRSGGSGPDADTMARVRGDKNRAMLLD